MNQRFLNVLKTSLFSWSWRNWGIQLHWWNNLQNEELTFQVNDWRKKKEKKLPLVIALSSLFSLLSFWTIEMSQSRWSCYHEHTESKTKKLYNRQSGRTLSGSHEVRCFSPKSECDGELDTIHGGTSEHALNANARENMQGTEVRQNNCLEANDCHSTFTFTYRSDLLLSL